MVPTNLTPSIIPHTASRSLRLLRCNGCSPIRRRAARVRSRQRVSICATPATVVPFSIASIESTAPRRRPRSRGVLSDQTCHREVAADGGQSERGFPVRVWGAEVVRHERTAIKGASDIGSREALLRAVSVGGARGEDETLLKDANYIYIYTSYINISQPSVGVKTCYLDHR